MIISYYNREKLLSYSTQASYKRIKEFLLQQHQYVVFTLYEKSDLRSIMSNMSRLLKFHDVKDIIHNLDKNREVDIYLWKTNEGLIGYEVTISKECNIG